MIWWKPQRSKEDGFAGGLRASSFWFKRNENRIDLLECFRLVQLQRPAPALRAVQIQKPQVESVFPIVPSIPPRLECAGIPKLRLPIQVVTVKDERFVFREEHARVRLLNARILVDIGYLRN